MSGETGCENSHILTCERDSRTSPPRCQRRRDVRLNLFRISEGIGLPNARRDALCKLHFCSLTLAVVGMLHDCARSGMGLVSGYQWITTAILKWSVVWTGRHRGAAVRVGDGKGAHKGRPYRRRRGNVNAAGDYFGARLMRRGSFFVEIDVDAGADYARLFRVGRLEAHGVAELGGAGLFVSFDGRVVIVIAQELASFAPGASDQLLGEPHPFGVGSGHVGGVCLRETARTRGTG